MEAFRSFWGGPKSDAVPSASVLAEWNKYASDDVEAGPSQAAGETSGLLDTAGGLVKSSFGVVSSSFKSVADTVQTGVQSVPTSTQWSYFASFMAGGALLLVMSFTLFLPMIAISPSRFALTFTLGCLCVMAAFAALNGWKQQLKHMVSKDRIAFSAGYVGSMLATGYAAVILKSYILSLVFCTVQVVALAYYVFSYFPGGTAGVQFVLQMCLKGLKNCCGIFFSRGS
ncbi:unnamed protein product [Ostreobium quekettii]|uniref:Vesicle transport protein n=1 Tax=Ostreobium quekettii TaxID=121088 RepID=A0A8S1J0L4_9CHLO|nr:unnamed protein product [Ostreobium quekettii]|eukprot:evm.model.scf_501.5 EVM.evm.TU.scf_501.5   scf_501:44336-47967(-)